MKSTGIVRCIDEVGRVVLPKELRRTMQLPVGTPIEIYVDGDRIVLRKYQPSEAWTSDELKDALVMLARETGRDAVEYLEKVRKEAG